MNQQTFHDAMRHWAFYFKQTLSTERQEAYWIDIRDFSDIAMVKTKDHVRRHFEAFPKLVHLIPVIQDMETRHGPRPREQAPSEMDRMLGGFGEWSERDLIREALGWRPLLTVLSRVGFMSEAAIDSTVKQGQRYRENLEQGLVAMGVIKESSGNPIAEVVAKYGDKPPEGTEDFQPVVPETQDELPF